MYGEDPLSRTDSVIGSDRFVVEWDLTRDLDAAPAAPTVERAGAIPVDPASATLPEAAAVRIEIPSDIQRIKTEDPDAARQWRLGTRRALRHYLEHRYRVRGLARAGAGAWYVLERS